MTSEVPPTWSETWVRAAAALVPDAVGGAAVGIVVDDVIARKRVKGQQYLADVTEGIDVELLRARLAVDRVGTLVLNAGEAAVVSAVDAKRRVLARVARNAILDDARVDEAELAVGVLERLESPHIASLARLYAVHVANPVDEHDHLSGSGTPETDPDHERPDAQRHRLAMATASQRESQGVLGFLAGLGLITQNGTFASIGTYDAGGLTDLGVAVMREVAV